MACRDPDNHCEPKPKYICQVCVPAWLLDFIVVCRFTTLRGALAQRYLSLQLHMQHVRSCSWLGHL